MRLPFIRRLGAERSGSTIVEFAMIAPVLILLVCGTIELGYLAMVKSSLETGVSRAARAARVDLTTPESERDEKLRAGIIDRMEPFTIAPGHEMVIETRVYRTFGASYPESWEDLNGNGRYDGPSGSFPGEPFDDRNRNGRKDNAIQEDGLLGGPGDVVAYHVTYPVKLLFGGLAAPWFGSGTVTLESNVVLRNEPIRGV